MKRRRERAAKLNLALSLSIFVMAEPKSTTSPKMGRGLKSEKPLNAAPKSQEEGGSTPIFRLPKFFTQGVEEAVAQEAPAPVAPPASDAAPATAPTASAAGASAARVATPELAELRDEIERLTEQVTQVNERESSLERVFDTLHAELSDYKNDFLYEHLKPVVRPLLFLFDSIEQFDSEVAMTQSAAPAPNATPGTLAASVVRENVDYFRDQLVEALRVCEVTIMEAPRGAFNSKFHKAVDVEAVPREQDGTIVRVVRSGWFLNGQLLRPAEVVVGKYRAPAAST